MGDWKILFCSANPSNTKRLNLEQEHRQISLSLQSAKQKFSFLSTWATTAQDLIQVILSEEPNIVHFSGHGTQTGIVLENEIRHSVIAAKDGLSSLFELFIEKINCVILNACYSEDQAKLINEYVPYVIGMSSSIPDNSAIKFTSGFYKALGAGKDIPSAFKFGVASIKLEGLPMSNTPLLLTNEILVKNLEDRDNDANSYRDARYIKKFNSGKSLIVVDIDDFTVIETKFGREVVNEIKRWIDILIKVHLERNHISSVSGWVVGHSDEYFIAIDTDLDIAFEIAENIRTKIYNYYWENISPSLFLTISCGIVDCPQQGGDAQALLLRALLGVQKAKIKGKNQTCAGPKFLPQNAKLYTLEDYISGFKLLKYLGEKIRIDPSESPLDTSLVEINLFIREKSVR